LVAGDKAGSISFITNDASYTATYADGVTAEIASVATTVSGAAYGLAFYTGTITGTNRGERMRITPDGNVGIGLTDPSSSLEVLNTMRARGSQPTIQFSETDTTDQNFAFRLNAGAMIFEQRNDDFSTQIERMRITDAGLVGIGTSSPDTLLEIVGADPVLTIRDTDTSTNTANARIRFAESGASDTLGEYWDVGLNPISALTFSRMGSEHARIDSAGNVGIGTTTVTPLGTGITTVAVNGTAGGGILFQRSDATAVTGLVAAVTNAFALGSTTSAPVTFRSNNIERMRIETDGTVYLGNGASSATPANSFLFATNGNGTNITGATMTIQGGRGTGSAAGGPLVFSTAAAGTTGTSLNAATERMRIDSSGNLGLGVTPSAWGSSFRALETTAYALATTTSAPGTLYLSNNSFLNSSSQHTYKNTAAASMYTQATGVHAWYTAPSGTAGNASTFTQAMTLDASGNLLVGATSTLDSGKLYVAGGGITHAGSQTNYRPGSGIQYELVNRTGAGFDFYVNNAATLAARIDSSGNLLVAKTAVGAAGVGVEARAIGLLTCRRDGGTPFTVDRLTNDGTLIEFYQASTVEGTISVSGTTVSYNGGHLSRWAQFPDNSRPELLKGTVMSNLDQMSNWDNEANEQLNCVQVSTVEGDANVAGVFVAWDSTDDGYNDILLAMTGDMVIRIAGGTTVQRGDLLMSAGDGTAKPQGDDIVRSKTIAKVTSTHVSHTYADGSYAVPCVLMAC
jgi:hypothetical protein